jgi:phosphohistidine phosphatase SixA
MKLFSAFFIFLFLLAYAGFDVLAQKRTITVMIFRHADKEAPTEGDETEPDLSIDGQKRAIRLVKVLAKYKPMRIFSTNYPRTIQTVTPLSNIRKLPIEFYEPSEMNALITKILTFTKQRRVVIVGHNSTAFKLVNMFLKDEKYKMPTESEYRTVWILRIKNGKVVDKLISY